ncbi:hypothetical protein FRC06_009962, partial [Ceratobasidium sp. 370]
FRSNPPSPFNSAAETEPSPSSATSRSRAHRDRTPPPLARIENPNQLTAEELVVRSDGFLVTGNIPQGTRHVSPIPAPLRLGREATPVQLESGLTLAAPTRAEFAKRRADEARTIQNARKTNDTDGDGEGGRKKIGSFPPTTQELIFLLRAGMQFDYLNYGPFSEKETRRFDRAKEFAQNLVNYDVDEIADQEVWRTMTKSNGQCRTAGQDEIKQEVARYFGVEEGDIEPIEDVLDDDRFLFPGGNQNVEEQFDVKIMVIVMAHLYFGTPRKLGFLYMDRLVEDDDPVVVAELLTIVSEAHETLTIVDQSDEARRGPSIAAIAFVAISIRHALERLKIPKQRTAPVKRNKGKDAQRDKGNRADKAKGKGTSTPRGMEFTERNYADHWARYVRALVAHPRLGALRNALLDELKQ